MKRILLVISLLFFGNLSFAQLSVGGMPKTFIHKDLSVLLTSIIEVEQPDLSAVLAKDELNENKGEIRRFAVVLPVGNDFFKKADYAEVDKGKIWVLRLRSNNAQALTVFSQNFHIPEGGELFIYNKDKSQVIGGFTSLNNNEYNSFATELIYGDEMVIEYFQPNEVEEEAVFEISEIGYAYRDCGYDMTKSVGFGASGWCNVNVNCPEGDNYRDAQRGVVRIQIRKDEYYIGWCTGSLINNTARDLAPYILSANHCIEGNNPSYYQYYVFYFNYESSGCSNGYYEPNSRTLTGTSVKAQGDKSDFALFRLNNNVPESYNAYWNAWNTTIAPSQSGVAIHHPSGDIKKISTYSSALSTFSTYFWEAQWVQTQTNYGITEGGSSGCPLFNTNSEIIGTLYGGYSSCDAPIAEKTDFFGKMSFSWSLNGSTNAKRLKPWLDPLNTGLTNFRGDDYSTYLTSNNDISQVEESYSRIYPNPAKNNINIVLSPQSNPIQVFIYDELSRVVLIKTIPANIGEYSINTENLSSGYYIIKFNSSNKVWVDKLIIN